MSKAQTMRVTVRTHKDGTPELFFVSETAGGWWLECYAHIGQHSECCREYMLSLTLLRPDRLTPEASALVAEWDSMGRGPEAELSARVVSRLTYPKGKLYIGK